ncbi:MAG TPA: malto-oligosyltrehalose trehalohydrolase [Blastocatellia bacterium]|nr:malto-oligosyltrehalose trehalohydrolase [Blastocatellia bacterium]
MRTGARYLGNGRCEFVVWSPVADSLAVRVVSPGSDPESDIVPMVRDEYGYWRATVEAIEPGARYLYRLNDSTDRPDPASHYQPEGVHASSAVVDHDAFAWRDGEWEGVALEQMITYELHVGAFTPEGTFDAVIERLVEVKELGVNAIEIMPVAQFPGERNWGYDGAYPYAVQASYGGPDGLKRLVAACHKQGLAVILDVVYNHLGPEGNYAGEFGPVYTDKYKSPWGSALNFDDHHSDGVRNHFIENAVYWFRDFHIDALRLDATQAIFDTGAKHFLAELSEAVESFAREDGRKRYLIAESDTDDVRVITGVARSGFGMDALWNDDFHHSLHARLTGERGGYYSAFGKLEHLAKAFSDGFVYGWEYNPYRKRRFGSPSKEYPAHHFVVCAQNHDQIGNRMLGERLASLVGFEAAKLAAASVLVSPYPPLLFMGEEYAEQAPFLFFVSYEDAPLVEAVREGRKREFEEFQHEGEVPDPQSPETFQASKLNWQLRSTARHKAMLDFYKRLIEIRKEGLNFEKTGLGARAVSDQLLILEGRCKNGNHTFCVMNFDNTDIEVSGEYLSVGRWVKVIDSTDEVWSGPGSSLPRLLEQPQGLTLRPHGFALYMMETIE